MPRSPIDYSKTIIYKLCCNDLNITDIYIGHTTDFKSRKAEHKYSCNNEKNKSYHSKVYQYIRNNGGWDNWTMIMIEEYNCNNKLEALKRERELIEVLKSTLNFEIPSRTHKEYREDNKDKIKEKYIIYYENNKDKLRSKYENNKDIINEKRKEKYICECGNCLRISDRERHFKTKKHQEYLNIN